MARETARPRGGDDPRAATSDIGVEHDGGNQAPGDEPADPVDEPGSAAPRRVGDGAQDGPQPCNGGAGGGGRIVGGGGGVGNGGRGHGGGGEGPEDFGGRFVDWKRVTLRVFHRLANWGRDPADEDDLPTRLPTSSQIADVVQQAITAQLAEMHKGHPLPANEDDLVEEILVRAKRWRDALKKTTRERRHNLELYSNTLSMREMFDVICARQEQTKFYARLYDSLDADGRLLLDVLLVEGVPFHRTQELQDRTGLPAALVTNLKRRIVRQSKPIMRELTGHPGAGGKS